MFAELGSGTGAVGLCAAALGCERVLLTDRPDFVEFLLHNIELNQQLFNHNITAQALLWGDTNQVRGGENKKSPSIGAFKTWDLCIFVDGGCHIRCSF